MQNKFAIITGQIGCGKSTVTKILNDQGYNIYDADDIAKYLQRPGKHCYKQIIKHFNNPVLPNNQLDRAKIALQVFGEDNKKQLMLLNSIIHPAVNKLIDFITICSVLKIKVTQGIPETFKYNFFSKGTIFIIPLCLENNKDSIFPVFDIQLESKELQLERLIQRGMNITDAKNRMSAQMSFEERKERANAVVFNDSNPELAAKQLDSLIMNYNGKPTYQLIQYSTILLLFILASIIYFF